MRISDWSSDVCSSDLIAQREIIQSIRDQTELEQVHGAGGERRHMRRGDTGRQHTGYGGDRKSVVSGKRVSVRVDLGGRRIIKQKKNRHIKNQASNTT